MGSNRYIAQDLCQGANVYRTKEPGGTNYGSWHAVFVASKFLAPRIIQYGCEQKISIYLQLGFIAAVQFS